MTLLVAMLALLQDPAQEMTAKTYDGRLYEIKVVR